MTVAHVVTRPNPPFLADQGRLRVFQLPAALDNLVWVVACTATGEAMIVDGPDADAALACVAEHGLTLVGVLNTHTHGDHIGVNRDLARRGLLDGLRVIGPRVVADDVPGLTEPVDGGDSVSFGAVRGEVIRTDGHLHGHVCYRFGDVLFSGDTLFTGGCGYLFDGTPAQMFDSLSRLATLPDDTRVCCAHEYTEDNLRFAWMIDADNAALRERIDRVRALRAVGGCAVPSTVGEERATNPFLRAWTPEVRAAVAPYWPDRNLSDPVVAFAAVRQLKDRRLHREVAWP